MSFLVRDLGKLKGSIKLKYEHLFQIHHYKHEYSSLYIVPIIILYLYSQ